MKLASPGLSGVNLSSDILRFYSDHLAQQLGLHGLRVTTEGEIQQLLGFERQKQLLGCADDSTSCLAELANALGVDGLVNGSIGRVGKSFQVNIKIISAQDGTPLAAFSRKVKDEEEVLDTLSEAAEKMSAQVLGQLKRTGTKVENPGHAALEPTDAPPEMVHAEGQSKLRSLSWIPLAGGAAFAVAGILLNRAAWVHADRVENGQGTLTDQQAQSEIRAGKVDHTLSLVSFGVAAAGAAAAGYMFFAGGGFGPQASVQVAVIPGTSPAISLSGRF